MAITALAQTPTEGLQPYGLFREGHTYVVKSRDRFALVRVVRIRSSVNPRLGVDRGSARGGRAGNGARLGRLEGEGDVLGGLREQERTDRILDSAQITIDLELILQEDGSANFQ